MEKLLTIGIPCYEDYDGAYFTIQALRLYHPICNTSDIEFIIMDNNPGGKASKALKQLSKECNGKYIAVNDRQSTFIKYDVVKYASGKYVIILDSHVLLYPNAIQALLDYYQSNPNCKNLIQGPLILNDLKQLYTHFNPVWRGHMYGTWATDERVKECLPFAIPMQGMGLCSFERKNWPGINEHFQGFGAEEWYIAEKFRNNGGENICLPSLVWLHKFDRPNGVPFRLSLEDRIFNYFLGWMELYNDKSHPMIQSIFEHFTSTIIRKRLEEIYNKAMSI